MYKQLHDINNLLDTSQPVARVEVTAIHGSTPRNSGTWMLVSTHETFRTIGGGQLENLAIEKARSLFELGDKTCNEMRVPLGPHIGQCCGGTVKLKIEVLDAAGIGECMDLVSRELENLPRVYIFGAGTLETHWRVPWHCCRSTPFLWIPEQKR